MQGIINFIIKYKFSIVFALIFIALFRQNILINKFPTVITEKQDLINELISTKNKTIDENEALSKQIDAYKDDDLVLIESRARYKYGLIKDNETYYQINTIIEQDNSNETPESNL